MPNRYVIANWKMNLPPEGIEAWLAAVGKVNADDVAAVIAPPFPYLREVSARRGHALVGAQNCADQLSGAYTGEVSARMLAACGAQYVILGHSERRTLFQESSAFIARKLAIVIESGLTPVLCIGEDLRERDAGHVARFLADQIREAAVPQLESASEVILAYEPIWAIGTGRNATGAMCAETIGEIREAISRFWPSRWAGEASLLYGGSVTPENVEDLVQNGRIDGFLVGGASLDSGRFLAIYRALSAT